MAGRRYWLAAARKALGLTQAKLAGIMKVDPGTISRWETGERVPSFSQMEKLAVELKLSLGEVMQGFGLLDRSVGPCSVAVAATLQDAQATPFPIGSVPPPASASHRDVEQIRLAATQLGALANVRGGNGIVRMTGHAQLTWAGALLRAECDEDLRPDLFAAVARLGLVVGAAAFDSFANEEARHAFCFAVSAAEEVSNWHLRCMGHVLLARHAIWIGDPDAGLTHVELALARSDRLTATERAMGHTVRARALAAMGRVDDALRAIGAADDAFAKQDRTEDAPWLCFYDYAQHQGDTGHALYDMALAGYQPNEALGRLRAAVDGHGDDYARSRAFSRAKLSCLQLRVGQVDEGVELGFQSVVDIEVMHSKRAMTYLRDVSLSATECRATEAQELVERVSQVFL